MRDPVITVFLRKSNLELIIATLLDHGYSTIPRTLQDQLRAATQVNEFRIPGWDLA